MPYPSLDRLYEWGVDQTQKKEALMFKKPTESKQFDVVAMGIIIVLNIKGFYKEFPCNEYE